MFDNCNVQLLDERRDVVLTFHDFRIVPCQHGMRAEGDLAEAAYAAGRSGCIDYYAKLKTYGFRCRVNGALGSYEVGCTLDNTTDSGALQVVPLEVLKDQPRARMTIADFVASDFKLLRDRGEIPEITGKRMSRFAQWLFAIEKIVECYPERRGLEPIFGKDANGVPFIENFEYSFADGISMLVGPEGILVATNQALQPELDGEGKPLKPGKEIPAYAMPGQA